MQIRENWADVVGQVRRLHAHPSMDDFVVVDIEIKDAAAVPGFPNMFERVVGEVVPVNFPRALAEQQGLQRGTAVRCRVRRAGPHSAFVHPDLAPD